MSNYNLQEALKTLSPVFYDIVAKSVCEHLAWQWGDGHPCALPLQDVTEVFEIRVTTADAAMAQFEGGDVGATYNLVVCVHTTAYTVCTWVLDLEWG